MKRGLVTSAAVVVALTVTACSSPDSAAPDTVAVTTEAPTATTVATTTPPTPSTTPPTTEPPKPVVTAVPVVMPIKQAVTTTVPPTTVPPTPEPIAPDNPASSWTGTNHSGNTTPLEVGWIEVPKIGIRYTAYRAADEYSDRAVTNAINRGPTFWGSTTRPGEPGNVVIAGHRVSHGAFFRNIDKLSPGDEIIVAGLDGVAHTYLVEQTIITTPNDLTIVNPRQGATITLFACHPPGSIRQRIVVYGNLKTA